MGFYAVDYYLENCNLSGNDKLAIIILAHHANDKDGTCYPGIDRIAEKLNITKRGAQSILSRLRDSGHIHISYNEGVNTGTGKTNLFKLTAYIAHIEGANVASSLSAQGVNTGAQGVNTGAQGVNTGAQGVNVASPKHTEEQLVDHTGEYTAREAHAKQPQHPPPLPKENEYLPGLPDPRRKKQPHTEAAERFIEAKDLGVEAVQYRELVDALLTGFGKKALVDAGDDSTLFFAQDLALTVMRMSEKFRTVKGIQSIFQSWKVDDWRGKKGELPTSKDFKEHASAMVAGLVGVTPATPPVTFKQWCLRTYHTDNPQIALGIPDSKLRAEYDQSIRVH